NLLSQEEYYPFGGTEVLVADADSGIDYKTHRYTGKERDATGLYYYRYRYYQPWAGRRLSSDTAGTGDGTNLY
ncbi:RHS repeat-associated core domain-containing protein, partial [Morganella morganii]|uniref:RHS repeat-associated core domain-containing protein n=1 Tax=Morganella morganii TaxID=582 RepID=UPI001FFD8E96